MINTFTDLDFSVMENSIMLLLMILYQQPVTMILNIVLSKKNKYGHHWLKKLGVKWLEVMRKLKVYRL